MTYTSTVEKEIEKLRDEIITTCGAWSISYMKKKMDIFAQTLRKEILKEVREKLPKEKSTGDTTIVNPTFPNADRDYFVAYNEALIDVRTILDEMEGV